ncbi:inhibitor of nuclear factor kappa-B kinase-interacting protein-like isoform X2 [Brienomyrus brachyistius]|uniref:inhibitor of nuclear factor kappa-B kinase-interacting protein-like isoform X2 n=1 Tax=Brienomyrus brachyistius TaxID=42636 RepID=UPI0020B2111F|nr:inhibitor of nuclear factor kappa-B kinase-interacting protein-like isoform X2 [Brienomyrus brachyistius]
MPGNEVKQRKKIQPQGNNNAALDQTLQQTYDKREKTAGDKLRIASGDAEKSSSFPPDIKTCVCLFFTVVCLGLAWIVLQQNARFSDLEEKYRLMNRKAGDLQELHVDVSRISQKLDFMEDDLLGMLSSMSRAGELQKEISSQRVAMLAEQNDESSDTVSLHLVSMHFQNVTEAHHHGLEDVVGEVGALRVETRGAHAQTAEHVNEVDSRLRALEERLEELEESTQRNMRALERSEEEDTLHARERVEWNTQRMLHLEERQRGLTRRDVEMWGKVEELVPRVSQCEGQLPAVEEAVHSILRLSANMIAVHQRAQKLTLQVLQLEQSVPKVASEILAMQKVLDRENTPLGTVKELVVIDDMRKDSRRTAEGRMAEWRHLRIQPGDLMPGKHAQCEGAAELEHKAELCKEKC